MPVAREPIAFENAPSSVFMLSPKAPRLAEQGIGQEWDTLALLLAAQQEVVGVIFLVNVVDFEAL